ncbi:hypothetical protein BGZ89_001700 [Linnemannia elongata]|nr:hypothetical protein BGZ89_001700 [Linnemannia elongata]
MNGPSGSTPATQSTAESNVDIKKKQQQEAPTPQNTPIFSAPISRPAATVEDDMETIQTPGTSLLGNNAQLMSMLQGRLGNLVGAPSNYLSTLGPDVRRRVKGLKSLQNKHSVLEADFQKEILALEKKYLALYTPLYEKRAEFISGKTEPTEAEVEDGVSEDEEEEDEDEDDEDKDIEKVEGIPEFWLTALKSHPHFADIITEKDEEALKHLVDIRMSYFDKPGFRLDFEFSPNEFFTNTILTKTYFYQDEPGYVAPEDEDDEEEMDEDLDEKLEADYGLGEELKDSIIPRAVDWFTGKALQYQDQGDQYDDDFEYDDEEGSDDDDEDDDDEDDDNELPAKDEKAPECKQQ